jgi:hypothetical protein
MSATDLLDALSDEQKAILATKKVKLTRTADELLALLKPIAAFDIAAAPARKKAGCTLAVFILLTIVTTVIALTQEAIVQNTILGVALVLAVVAVIIWRSYKKLASADIADTLSHVVVPFLAILREDVTATEPIDVDIDLSPDNAKEKLASEDKLPKKGAYYKIIQRIYMNPWFEGHTTFADGTRVSWKVVDRIRELQKTKKNPRGKIKTKTKRKLRTEVAVKLGFPTKRFVAEREGVVAGEKRASMVIEKTSKGDLETKAFQLLIDAIAAGYSGVSAQKGAAR